MALKQYSVEQKVNEIVKEYSSNRDSRKGWIDTLIEYGILERSGNAVKISSTTMDALVATYFERRTANKGMSVEDTLRESLIHYLNKFHLERDGIDMLRTDPLLVAELSAQVLILEHFLKRTDAYGKLITSLTNADSIIEEDKKN